jgi:hypothetical protein
VRLCLVRNVEDVCGGEIKGGGLVIRFCSKPRDMCDVASHTKGKATLKPGCLYPYVPKKGTNQVRLEPCLPLTLVPPDETLGMLLLEEKSIALWQTYMDACKASECRTGRNELGELNPRGEIPDWEEHVEAPSLEDLANADDFKTPKKVRIMAPWKREPDDAYHEPPEIGSVPPLNIDLSDILPLEGLQKTPKNQALLRIMLEWDGLALNFGTLKSRFLAHETLTGQMKEDVLAQFLESNHYVNELGNKARILAARIGKDGRKDEPEASVWETLNILHEGIDQTNYEVKSFHEKLTKILDSSILKDVLIMGMNMGKLAKAYKQSMTAINGRLITLETQVDKMAREGGTEGDDQFNFNSMSSFDASVRADVDGRIRKLQDRIRLVEEKAKDIKPTASENVQGDNLGRNGSDIHHTGRSPEDLGLNSASYESLLGRLDILESRATDKTCVFGGFHFSTIHDVITFVTTYGVPTCAMYWDMMSAMVCMRSKGETGKEQSERKYAAQKANVHSALEADLVASMSHERPLCLYSKDKKELATYDKGFAACASYKIWMSGGTQSYLYQLDYDFRSFCGGLTGRTAARGRSLSTGDFC